MKQLIEQKSKRKLQSSFMEKELFAALGTVYSAINRGLFKDELPDPTFIVNVKRKSAFKFEEDKFQISLGSHFPKSSFREMLDDLLHEVVHIANYLESIPDYSPQNLYHNKKFRSRAISVGLTCIKSSHGWRTTTSYPILSDTKSISFPLKKINNKRERIYVKLATSLNRSLFCGSNRILAQEDKKNYFLKYVCGCDPPHNSIRSGRRPNGPNRLNMVCMDCLQPFRCES